MNRQDYLNTVLRHRKDVVMLFKYYNYLKSVLNHGNHDLKPYETKILFKQVSDYLFKELSYYDGIKYHYNTNKELNPPIDGGYLQYLLSKLDNISIVNPHLKGLINLLSDSNMIYNHVGVKINIAKFVIDNIDVLQIHHVNNLYLRKKYRFLIYKNNKALNFSKLYYENGIIFINTVLTDGIQTVCLYNPSIFDIDRLYGVKMAPVKSISYTDNLLNYQYTYIDKEEQFYNNCSKLIALFKLNKAIKENLTNLSNHEKIFMIRKYINLYHNNDKVYNIYLDIEEYLDKENKFKSNDLNLKSCLDDYDNFKYSEREYDLFNF